MSFFGHVWQNDWVICRVFQKSLSGKKTLFFGNELGSSILPPLTDSSPSSISKTKSPYVSCFSNPIDVQRNNQVEIFDSFNNTPFNVPSNHSLYYTQGVQNHAPPNFPLHGSVYNTQEDHSILRTLLDDNNNNGLNLWNGFKSEREIVSVSQETCLTTIDVNMNAEISNFVPPTSAAPMDLATMWNY